MKIWLDDLRSPPDNTWVICRNYNEFLSTMGYAKYLNRPIEVVSFDHDLADAKDGYDCIKLCASPEFCEVYPLEIAVHSANPVGKENIIQYDLWYRRMRAGAFAAMEDI